MKERTDNGKIRIAGLILTAAALTAVFLTEQIIKPGYWIKSAVKVSAFGGAVLIYMLLSGKKLCDLINLHKPKSIRKLLLCIALFFVGIIALFLIFKSRIDMASIRQSLVTKEGLTRKNCFFVFAYIIIVNSFLEEAFFRGFLSGIIPNKKIGYPVSALMFSLYHIGIIGSWFHPLILLLCIAGLAAVGLFLQFLSERFRSVAAGWIVHASANVAINTIGALLIFEVI
ncbi:MAG: CPBP family intramembrane metalloprotease [Lachnospiraceae bacterium]|nr:CPBP family intramembrane metalloprotease [Lachnospiraceae bacterium]